MADKVKRVGNTVRREKNAEKMKRSLSLALALALIIVSALVGLKIAENTSVDAMSSSEKQSGSYPVSFSTNDIKDVRKAGKNMVYSAPQNPSRPMLQGVSKSSFPNIVKHLKKVNERRQLSSTLRRGSFQIEQSLWALTGAEAEDDLW